MNDTRLIIWYLIILIVLILAATPTLPKDSVLGNLGFPQWTPTVLVIGMALIVAYLAGK